MTGEMIRTGLRLVVIAVFIVCYRRFFLYKRQISVITPLMSPLFFIAVALLLLLAAVNTNAENEPLMWQLLFAFSGLTAGLREELFYRGLVQQQLQQSYGDRVALPVASVFFTLSHVQYMYYGQWHGLLLIAVAGIIFGSIFIYSRSIVVTSCVHGLYDALLSFKISTFKIDYNTALCALSVILLLLLLLIRPQLSKLKPDCKR